jgi:hypothetical protein
MRDLCSNAEWPTPAGMGGLDPAGDGCLRGSVMCAGPGVGTLSKGVGQ